MRAIGYPHYKQKPDESISVRRVCCMCNKTFGPFEQGVVSFETDLTDAKHFCYNHVLNLAKVPDTYLPSLPIRYSTRFEFTDFLRTTALKLCLYSDSNPKLRRTLRIINEFLKKGRIRNLEGYLERRIKEYREIE